MAEKTETRQVLKREALAPTEVERTSARPVFVPLTDIYETKDSVVVLADMPGVDEKSLDVRLNQGILTITGHMETKAPGGHDLMHGEFSFGDYERAFTLSDEVDPAKIRATLKDGVLRLVLNRKEAAKPTKIVVKTE